MSLLNIFDIAGSAMSAQTVRLNTTASNLANVDSVSSSTEQTYRARQPIFETLYSGFMHNEQNIAGVHVTSIVESQMPLRQEYRPEHPNANEEGYVFLPNVNAIEEMANMISASRAYQNNVEVINASKEMMLQTLSLGQ